MKHYNKCFQTCIKLERKVRTCLARSNKPNLSPSHNFTRYLQNNFDNFVGHFGRKKTKVKNDICCINVRNISLIDEMQYK